MKIPRSLTFLYMPEDPSRTRQFSVPRGLLCGAGLVLVLLVGLAALFLAGLGGRQGWRPGGSELARENEALTAQIATLEARIADLGQDLDAVHGLQSRVAQAVDLDPLDPNVWQAGVGGRFPQTLPGAAAPSAGLATLSRLEGRLDKLLRQARIQNECFETLVDSLDARDDVRRHLPSIRPVDVGWLSSAYGMRKDPFTGQQRFHHGLDYSIPTGTPVRVTADGVVLVVKNDRIGFGRVVKVDHGNGIVTIYAHLSKPLVKKGQVVHRGDAIAESGESGRCTAPHLHYEVRVRNQRVNPLPYILDSYARN